MTSALDEADRYIEQGYPKDALKVLSDCEKKILNPMEAVGVYKRYAALDNKKAAERVLKKNLKKNPESPELNAVYVCFLKDSGRTEEALKLSKILRGSKYGGLYSELYFHSLQAPQDQSPRVQDFLTEDMALF